MDRLMGNSVIDLQRTMALDPNFDVGTMLYEMHEDLFKQAAVNDDSTLAWTLRI